MIGVDEQHMEEDAYAGIPQTDINQGQEVGFADIRCYAR